MASRRAFLTGYGGKLQNHDKNPCAPVLITEREPVPLDSRRPSLAFLPDDIMLHLLSFVRDSSPEDLRTIASLGSFLYAKARYVQQRTVTINLDKLRHARNRLDIISRYDRLRAIQIVEINGSKTTYSLVEEDNRMPALVAEMLPGMTGLRDLYWNVGSKAAVPIPLYLLHHLLPQVHLHTSVFCEDAIEHHHQAREFLSRLLDNQNLFSLSAEILFIQHSECLKTTRLLKKVLLSCPNLVRIPNLHVWFPIRPLHGVWDGMMPGAPYCGLGLSGGEKPPPLEELGVDIYPWGHEPKVRLVKDEYDSVGYPEKGLEWNYWANAFDWSRLRILRNIPSNLACEIAPKLTHLREVLFSGSSAYWQWEFLEGIPSVLERLSIPSWGNINKRPGLITQYGSALRSLTIHTSREPWPADSLVTDYDLVKLCDGIPHLEELVINLGRDKIGNNWPYTALDIIARKLLRLRSLELGFELGGIGAPYQIPHLTVYSARQLFRYIRQRNNNIQRLALYTGFEHQLPHWASHNSISLVCDISVFDGDATDGFIKVTCSDLSSEMNAELRRLAVKDKEEKKTIWTKYPASMPLELRVALDGPLSDNEWTSWKHLT
jgi:hypothetical protein